MMKAVSLVVRATSVSVGWLAFNVIVRVPVLPSVRGRTGGARLTTAGGGGMTVTWLWTLVPLRGPAVTVTVPGTRPVRGTRAVTAPTGTVTLAGTMATPGSLVLNRTIVSVACVALMVTVRVPLAPCVTWRVAGRRRVRVGPAGVTVTVL